MSDKILEVIGSFGTVQWVITAVAVIGLVAVLKRFIKSPEAHKPLTSELTENKALTEEETKARIDLVSDSIVPEIMDEKLNPKYAREFSEEGFWDKITSVLKSAGAEVVYKALQLYYATQNPACPIAMKGVIYAALGYFILPVDIIPDFIPVVGFTDDLLAIGAAIGMASMYIDDSVIRQAQDKMRGFFGDEILNEI